MKFVARSVIIFGFLALTTQDIAKKKGCDCSICKGADNRIANPVAGRKFQEEDGGGKPGCSLCERKKEMLRMEREKQKQLQKCPFEILGSPHLKGKTSGEIFDEFRELIVPSQNGFFDMMRGIVKTMHVSTEAELKWAQEKEARDLAKKKAEEARKRIEEARQVKSQQAAKKAEAEPKVTVVLKQTPCQQFLGAPSKSLLLSRLIKQTLGGEKKPTPNMQLVDLPVKGDSNHLGLDADTNSRNEDLVRPELLPTSPPPGVDGPREGPAGGESLTETPFVKFLSDEEFKAQSGRADVAGGLGFDLLEGSSTWGEEPQGNFLHSPPKESDQRLQL